LIAVLVEKSRCDNINFLRDNFSNWGFGKPL
jgi:hypothetical protein